jgi:pimeloyl-ACP methyl ester carboxylesterase
MAYAIVNGIRMHYEAVGNGDAVLLLSALSMPAAMWSPQVKALSPHFRVITFDHRGVGETDLPPEPVYTMGQLADDAAALLRQLKIARTHVVGVSMGGTVAQELALRHAPLVRSLVLVSAWAKADARFVQIIESWASLASRVPIEERYRHVFFPWVFSPAFFEKKDNVETAFRGVMAYPHQTKAEAIERQTRGILAWNGSRVARLGSIRVPTLVVGGKDDIVTPPQFARALAKLLPRARLILMAGGHSLIAEQTEAFNRTLLRFLKSVRSK